MQKNQGNNFIKIHWAEEKSNKGNNDKNIT